MEFHGFHPQGLDLLIENRLMNSQMFYEEHKAEIKKLAVEPFYALCERMTEEMLAIDPCFVTVPSRMVSRVRRDTRYTKDKTLYRANLWLYFRRKRAPFEDVPFFYVEVHPEFWAYGCWGGFGRGEMAAAREMLLREAKLFPDAHRADHALPDFILRGEEFKRPKHPDAPAAYQPWLNRKQLGCDHIVTDSFDPLFDGTFVEPMLDAFRRLAPFYTFLRAIKERANPTISQEGKS